MPRTIFIFNKRDTEVFANFLFASECALIPDYFYKKPDYITIKALSDFVDCRSRSGRFASQWVAVQFFVVGSWPQTEEFYFRPIKKDGQQRFYISQREGGFALMLGVPAPDELDGRARLGFGELSYWPKYWSRVYETEVPPPEQMKEFYDEAKKFIVKNSRPRRVNGRIYRIGRFAAHELDTGRAVISADPEHPSDVRTE